MQEEKEVMDIVEETTETIDIDEMELLPEGYEEEEPEEVAEEATEEEPEEVEETTETDLGELEVKFLGEVKALKDIPKDELSKFIQMGMNQERLQTKYNEAADTISEITEVAQLYGFDNINDMASAIRDSHFNSVAEKEGRKPEDVKREYESNRKSKQDKMFEKFVTKFPDVKPDNLPDNVKQSVKDGMDITEAYEKHVAELNMNEKDNQIKELQSKLEELEKKVAVKTQNDTVKKKAVVKSVSGSDDNRDDFLSGFFG